LWKRHPSRKRTGGLSDAWKNAEYILDAESFQGVEFHVVGEADGDVDEKQIERIESKGGDPVG
jgi:hypothetical protein